jgi:hypothetical protein
MSRYTLLGPRPFDIVTAPLIVLSRGGIREDFLGGRAGFEIALVNPIASGTVVEHYVRILVGKKHFNQITHFFDC